MKKIIFWVLCISILASLLFASTFFIGLIPDRRNVDGVTYSFIESKAMAEEYFRSHTEMDRISLFKRIKQNDNIDDVIISENSVLLISKHRKFSVLFEEKKIEGWRCTTFPEVSYKNLCSMFNLK